MESAYLICQNPSNWIKIQHTFRLGIKNVILQNIVDNSIPDRVFFFVSTLSRPTASLTWYSYRMNSIWHQINVSIFSHASVTGKYRTRKSIDMNFKLASALKETGKRKEPF